MEGVQLPLRFEIHQNYGEEDFLKSKCNALALAAVASWPKWPSYGMAIFGSPKVGKTHLAHIFQKKSQGIFLQKETLKSFDQFEKLISFGKGYILEDVYPWAQTQPHSLFHLCNLIKERHSTLLLTAEQSPAVWEIPLADLKSRISFFPAIRVDQPDDDLLEAILVKKISERQIELDPSVQRYILTHIERSASFLIEFLERLDAHSYVSQRKITIPLVRELLSK